MAEPRVAVLDYGSGNVRSVVRMLERVGARVDLTAERGSALDADGLYVPGVGNYHACLRGLRAVGGDDLVRQRVDRGRPVLGVCVGHQVLFDRSTEPSSGPAQPGLGAWEGEITRLDAPVVPHMGWSRLCVASGSRLFAGLSDSWFYFVHSYAAVRVTGSRLHPDESPLVTMAHHGTDFVAAVEDGVLCGTQFHPEKSGDAGATLLENWIGSL